MAFFLSLFIRRLPRRRCNGCSPVLSRAMIAPMLVLALALAGSGMPLIGVETALAQAASGQPPGTARAESPPATTAAPVDRLAGLPRWASIRPTEARTRAGPGRNYPILWLYRRAGLPVLVLERFESWRKIRDPDGAQGWIQANLLAEKRTALVIGKQPVPMRDTPGEQARMLWQLAPGVSGAIEKCDGTWCQFETGKVRGFVVQNRLWGLNPGEVLP